jgi:gamma-glutamyltranspeptidase/glutathione hydrolase
VVVVSGDGQAIAMNHSLAGSGGSGVITDGLGFLYNNSMAGFDAIPGGRNGLAPGKARWSAACPTIAVGREGDLVAVTGPGGSRAFAAVLEVLLGVTTFREAPAAAVDVPRFDVRGSVVDVEPEVPATVRERLRTDGWSVEELPGRHVAAVYTATLAASGELAAGADARWPGSHLTR